MILAVQHPVWLVAGDEREPFDPIGLRDSLARSFQGAGLADSAYLAGDIALAVEYALEHSGRPELIFSRAEIDDMVVRILENTGYGEVSAVYRQGAPARSRISFSADQVSVEGVLKRYFAGSAEHLRQLAGQTAAALKSIGAAEASPELMVELARHFDTFAPAPPVVLPDVLPDKTAVRRVDDHFILRPEEVRNILAAMGNLPETICRVHGVGRLFPSIRMAFFLTRLARQSGWEAPVLEMELQPHLAEFGRRMSLLRDRILGLYRERIGKPAAELPFYLSFPDMDDFIGEYLESSPEGIPGLRRSVAELLLAGMDGPVEKIRFAE